MVVESGDNAFIGPLISVVCSVFSSLLAARLYVVFSRPEVEKEELKRKVDFTIEVLISEGFIKPGQVPSGKDA